MAKILTYLQPKPDVVPWTGLDDVERQSAVGPRAEVVYEYDGEAVATVGAGDTQQLYISMSLPPNFAYSFAEISAGLVADDIVDWLAVAQCIMVPGPAGLRKYRAMYNSTSTVSFDGGTYARVWQFPDLMTRLLIPESSATPQVIVQMNNIVEEGDAAELFFMARFYQYDIVQAHDFQANTPILIR